jgi:ABC-2 type transport system permease protein
VINASTNSAGWMAAWALCERELRRFVRQRSRVIGALGQPLIFWVIFGAGLKASFKPAGAPEGLTYGEYFFPGVLAMIILFTSIFATISIIEDRREGFLQGVLVSPTGRVWIVLGKVLGGAILATVQAWVFMALALIGGLRFSFPGWFFASIFLAVGGIGLTSLGVCLAWRSESTQGFHAIMSVFLFPMWLLSGAMFPAEGAPSWLEWTIHLNPVTYLVEGLRWSLWSQQSTGSSSIGSGLLYATVSAIFAGAMFVLATRIASRN